MAERRTPPAVKATLRRATRGLDGFSAGRCVTAIAIMEQWCATALFRRVCRRPSAAVKPGGLQIVQGTTQIKMEQVSPLADSRL
jgi:hypothetical protein